mmetsp:Transcript_49386/g.139869  ORF Transcript_49386/g.139869 Transcript_49386/m.139869 type:complete len:84 (-) Transcript_49386:63-314(-)
MGDDEEHRNMLKRESVILLGDSMGDVTMGDGGPFPPSTILRIGFCNKDLDANLDNYKRAFDCVILNDGSMAPVVTLLEGVIGQ